MKCPEQEILPQLMFWAQEFERVGTLVIDQMLAQKNEEALKNAQQLQVHLNRIEWEIEQKGLTQHPDIQQKLTELNKARKSVEAVIDQLREQ